MNRIHSTTESREWVVRLCAAHRSLRSLQASFRVLETMGLAEQESGRGSLWIARPGRACLEFDPPVAPPAPTGPPTGSGNAPRPGMPPMRPGDDGEAAQQGVRRSVPGKPTLASDGRILTFAAPPAGWYWSIPVRPNESAVRQVFDLPRYFDIGFIDILDGTMPWGGDFKVLRVEPNTTVGGVPCREIVVTCGVDTGTPAEARLSIGVEDNLLRRIRSERTDGSGGSSEVTLTNVAINRASSPERYRAKTAGLTQSPPGTPWVSPLPPGKPAPLLIGNDRRGREIDIADWAGSVVLVHFWAMFAPRSLWRVPEIAAVHARFGKRRDFRVIGVCLDPKGREAAMDRVIRSRGMRWPQLWDGLGWDSGPAKSWGIEGLPVSALIGRDGRIFEMDPAVSLQQSVEAALAVHTKPKR